MSRRVLVVGASRGIGAEVSVHLHRAGDEVLSVSRSSPAAGTWIKADVTRPDGLTAIGDAVGPAPLDALLFMGGTWERDAFTKSYSFELSSNVETEHVLAVNLAAPIHLVQLLAPNLKRAPNPHAVFIGALSGLDQSATAEVANSASKYGLRGAVQAMRIALQGSGIGFTVINPGNLATAEVEADIAEGRFEEQTPIPMADLLSALDCVLAMSPAAEISELNLRQRG